MAETPSKRQREDYQKEEDDNNGDQYKRPKSINNILTLLEDHDHHQEDEQNHDLSSLISNLQQELSPSDSDHHPDLTGPTSENEHPNKTQSTIFSTSCSSEEEVDGNNEKERVMRHLLEASDDELGIPSTDLRVNDCNGDGFNLCDAFWELEDEAANYYALLQCELFNI